VKSDQVMVKITVVVAVPKIKLPKDLIRGMGQGVAGGTEGNSLSIFFILKINFL